MPEIIIMGKGYDIFAVILFVLMIFTFIFSLAAYATAGQASSRATVAAQDVAQFSGTEPAILSNQISLGLANSVLQLNNATANITSATIRLSGGFSGVNYNISKANQNNFSGIVQAGITSGIAPLVRQLGNLSENVSKLPAEISNISRTSNVTYKDQENYTIQNNTYFYSPMLPGYSNHINFTANKSVTLTILTSENYADLAANKSFGTINTYSGTTESFYFNQSESCLNDVYVISAAEKFELKLNVTSTYKPQGNLEMC